MVHLEAGKVVQVPGSVSSTVCLLSHQVKLPPCGNTRALYPGNVIRHFLHPGNINTLRLEEERASYPVALSHEYVIDGGLQAIV
jgi:hypothetical protein